MMNRTAVIVILLFLFSNALGQSGKPSAFEVASVKQATFPNEAYFAGYSRAGICNPRRVTISGKRAFIEKATLCGLIRLAYGVQEQQVSGAPKWMKQVDQSLYYDVQATVPDDSETLTTERVGELLRPLLADRFQLKFHKETRDLQVYALLVAKNGPKLRDNAPAPQVCARAVSAASVIGPGLIASCQPNSMAMLAERLTRDTDRPVIDKTGLTGKYVFELRWASQLGRGEVNDLPSLFTAVQEQLGLRLQGTTARTEVLVIDHAERPTAN